MNKPIKLKLTSPIMRIDPWGEFASIRQQGPLVPFKSFMLGSGLLATTYESVSQVLKNDELFVRDPANAGRKTMGRMQLIAPRSLMTLSNNMIAKDGIDHRRLRGLVDQAFARRSIESMSDQLVKLAVQQVEECKNVARQNGEVDLVEGLARPFPFMVICELLGLPPDCRSDVQQWLRPLSNFSGVLDFFRLTGGVKKMKRFLSDQFRELRTSPREGLISELIAVQDGGDNLSDDELMAMVFLLFIAGHETTVHLISNCILLLTEFPDARKALVSDWQKCDAAIEEVLRYASPIQFAKPRWVSRDETFFDVDLKRGQMVLPLLASANYDPARFSNPHEFQIDRESNYHLTFGSGPHTCLGIKLARSETRHVLEALYTHWPNFKVCFEPENVQWTRRPGIRGVQSLKVKH